MGWREFIASLVNSLAWPVAVVVLVIVLRSQIGGLFSGTLRRLKVGPGGAEIEWPETEREAAVAVASSVGAISTTDSDLEAELDAVESMIETTPAVAVRRSFGVIEDELRRIVREKELEVPVNEPDMNVLIKVAHRGGAITPETGNALRGLLELRNLTNHDPWGTSTTPEKARDFLNLTRSVLYALGAFTLA